MVLWINTNNIYTPSFVHSPKKTRQQKNRKEKKSKTPPNTPVIKELNCAMPIIEQPDILKFQTQ